MEKHYVRKDNTMNTTVFLQKYNKGVKKYVLFKELRKKIHAWYNARCTDMKKAEDKAWKKLIKQRNDKNRQQYKDVRN
ncbi:hypothetical protein E2C01_042588 [Portunus trituberculatus]|uniref:Uncharacterized protein n=1 Tax=Portunus trituberculatus TaxID=210409 RepID=A0A5B7FU01_PORTR|nr:hypothetical protein [Portunus trituberculatus]